MTDAKEIKINVPLITQRHTDSPEDWENKICGICCLGMLLSHKGILFESRDSLLRDGLDIGAYLPGIGWAHQGLVNLAGKFGLTLSYIKQFPKTREEKVEVEKIITESLNGGNPVMASVRFNFAPVDSRHLVLVIGLKTDGENVIGYHIQDPDSHWSKANNYFVSREDFLNAWRGGLIFISNSQ